MRTHLDLLALVLIAGAATSQSNTLPKGYDTKDGTDAYGAGTANSYFWAGFRVTSAYMPAKALYNYDASLLPFDTSTGPYTINKISFRADAPRIPAGGTTAHTKKMVVIMSTSSDHPAQANFNFFDGNHGANRKVVFGTIGTGKDVSFPATSKPAAGPAPFNAAITLDTPFVVPKDTKTLVVELRAYSASTSTGNWDGDSVRYDGANYTGGTYTLINTDHCVSPSIFFTSRAVTLGSNFGHIWRSGKSPGGKPVITWLGPRNSSPFLFPGSTSCKVHVFPVFAVRMDTSETGGSYAVYVDWGTVPANPVLVGAKVAHQSMFVDASYPGGVGLTRGGESSVGSGYDKNLVPGSQVYSYGTSNTRYLPATDPDTERYGRNFYRRVAVMKIN